MDARIERVGAIAQRVASICGVSPAFVHVGADAKIGCKLTRNGIALLLNHEVNEDIAARERFGVRGKITLEQVDVMEACFVATRAQDFLLDDWRQDVSYGEEFSSRTQRYLQSCIDNMAAYARMVEAIPFAKEHFEAYLSRRASHAMSNEALHLQFMRALVLYIFEEDAQIAMSPFVTVELGPTTEMKPFVEELKTIVYDEGLSYCERHEKAAEAIAVPFSRLLKVDERYMRFNELTHLYDNEEAYDASKEAFEDENVLRQEAQASTRSKNALKVVNESNIDQLIADNNEAAPDQMGSPNLSLPSLPAEVKSMELSDACAGEYEKAVARWSEVIEGVAEVLVKIATPRESLSVPRYDARLSHSGARMHPNAIVNAMMQLESGQEKALWQRARRTIRPQNLKFNGLDVFLLLDVSYSMRGENAICAADMSACLTEGLEQALKMSSEDPKSGDIDVRTQLLAFGEGWAELTPLEALHTDERKRFAFAQISNPKSEQTLVASALQHVRDHAASLPSRNVLCIVVGDGLFADGLHARKCAMTLPENTHLAHINIGEFSGLPLTENFETIQNPAVLPARLHSVLSGLFE